MATKEKELATDGFYTLRFYGGKYHAGCRTFTRTEAIKHWKSRLVEPQTRYCAGPCYKCDQIKRAKIFLEAIKKFKEPKKAKRKVAKKAARKAK